MQLKLKKVQEQVLQIMREIPRARDSDRFLIMAVCYTYYRQCGGYFTDVNGNKKWGVDLSHPDAPTAESIRRWRQKIQSDGQCLPTKESVARQRRLNMSLWREAMGYSS